MIELRPSPDQLQIVGSIAGYVNRQFPVERLQPKTSCKTVRSAWRELAEQGFFGLAASEGVGGAGFSMVEEMLAHREFARVLLSPSVLAAALAIHLLEEAGQPELAASLVAGDRPVAMALPRGRLMLGPTVEGPLHLLDSAAGDLVVLHSPEGLALIDRADLVAVEPIAALDESVLLHRARAVATRTLAFAPASGSTLRQRCRLLLAAALAGMAEAARDQAVEHARVREQFGKPIGSFQGVAHHCADMELRARAARAQTAFAAIALRDGRADASFQIAAAAIVGADAGIRNATMAIRVLGGMGFTAECPLHLYLKRSHLFERLAGGSRALEEDILRYEAGATLSDT